MSLAVLGAQISLLDVGDSFRQSHFHVSDSLTDMDITERNQQLAFDWHTSLTQDERDNLANGNYFLRGSS